MHFLGSIILAKCQTGSGPWLALVWKDLLRARSAKALRRGKTFGGDNVRHYLPIACKKAISITFPLPSSLGNGMTSGDKSAGVIRDEECEPICCFRSQGLEILPTLSIIVAVERYTYHLQQSSGKRNLAFRQIIGPSRFLDKRAGFSVKRGSPALFFAMGPFSHQEHAIPFSG
jgi:hypothetical protein